MPQHLTLPSRPARPLTTVSCLLARADSLLLVAPHTDADVRIDSGTVASRSAHLLRPGSTLLVSAGDRPVHVNGRGFEVHPVASTIGRLLAFHDHSMSLQRPLPVDRRACTVLPVGHDLRDVDTAQRWLIKELLGDDAAFHEAARLWASREAYQLIRFVLETPDCGVQQLADRYGLSVAQFRRIGRKAFGRSLKEQLRLLRAGRVLHRYADTGHTFTRLSSDFGFSSPSHFCSEIKSLLGMSPSSIYQSVHLL